MEEHYIKDVGKITYVYGVNLEKHKMVIEKQQKRIAELEQELAEMTRKYEFSCRPVGGLVDTAINLEKQLAELKEKDNYHLRYELAGADETITNLKKQIEENGKEINTKNNKLAELKKELTICKDTLRRKTQSNRDLQHRVHNVNTQLAIQELEKVKEEMDLNGNSYCEIRQGTSPHNPTDYAWFNYVKFRNYLNQQIKELKGEK